MRYDDIRLYRPSKICGCLRVEVVWKEEHDQECNPRGARACTKAVSVTQTRWLSMSHTQGDLRHDSALRSTLTGSSAFVPRSRSERS